MGDSKTDLRVPQLGDEEWESLIIGAEADKDLIEKFSPFSDHDLPAGSLVNIMKDRIAPFFLKSTNLQLKLFPYKRGIKNMKKE